MTPEELHGCHRWFPLDELTPLPGNPNIGDAGSLDASIDEFGWIDGIIVHQGVILAGNHRYRRAQTDGLEGLPGYDLSDLDLSDARRLALAVAHNETTRAGRNDPVLLAEALATVAASDRGLADVAGLGLADANTDALLAITDRTVERLTHPDFAPTDGTDQTPLDLRPAPIVCRSCGEVIQR